MLKGLGYDELDALIDAAVPGSLRNLEALDLPAARPSRRCSRNYAAWPGATWSPSP